MAGGYSVTISATDNASKAIERVNASLARMVAPVNRVRAAAEKLAKETGITATAQAFGRTADAARNLGRQIGSVIAPLGVITGAASIAGMVRMTGLWGEFASRLGQAAYRIQTTAANLHSLQGAARLAGGSAESMTAGLRTLGDTLVDAVGGRNNEAVQYLNLLGISLRGATGEARTAEEVLPELADRIAAIRNPALQARVATAMLGGAAEDLLPVLRGGSAAMREYQEQARRYGVVNEAGVRAAQDLRRAQAGVGLAFEGLRNSIAEKVAPVLTRLLQPFSEFIARNREVIALKIGQWAEDLATWLNSINWPETWAGVERFFRGVGDVVEALGGWKNAALAVVVVMNASLIASVLRLTREVGMLALAFGTTLVRGVGLAVAALAGFNRAAMANPAFRVAAILMGIVDGARGVPVEDLPDATRRMFERPGGPLDPARPENGGITRPATPPPADGGAASATSTDAVAFFQQQGWTREQAIGLAANIQHESGGRAAAVGDGGRAYGLAQWHPDRQAAFARWAGRDMRGSSAEQQMAFMHYELTEGAERPAGDRLRGAQTAGEAGSVISRFYERPRAQQAEALARAGTAERMAATLPAIVAGGGATGGGQVQVQVSIGNAPPGTTATASASGAAAVEAPRVQTAMPGGLP